MLEGLREIILKDQKRIYKDMDRLKTFLDGGEFEDLGTIDKILLQDEHVAMSNYRLIYCRSVEFNSAFCQGHQAYMYMDEK